jgi:signal transduction histidine kinase
MWDPDRLAQVVSNLVNATTYGCSAGPVAVTLADEERAVTFEVYNPGPPIPSEVMPVLFDPIRRSARTQAPRGEGFGLGLFIANQMRWAARL